MTFDRPADTLRSMSRVKLAWCATLVAATAVAAASACSFDRPASWDWDAGAVDAEASIDSTPPDAPSACVANTVICDEATERYIECSAEGTALVEIPCALGCAVGVEKCIDVAPSNGLASSLDRARDDDTVVAVTLADQSTIDTDSGMVFNGTTGINVPSDTVGGIRVFLFKSLTVTGTVKVTGAGSLFIASDGDVVIAGLLDVSADGATMGPGAQVAGCNGVNGGFSGGADSTTSGGGGGGRHTAGAAGGASSEWPGGAGGNTAIDEDISPLIGGCVAGYTFYIGLGDQPGAAAGGGGGAVQIVSRTRILLSDGGKIDASGGGGQSSDQPGSTLGGGGGGSGGGVLLEAPQVALDGAGVVISTKGAGGAAVGNGSAYAGTDGGTNPTPAAGGSHGSFPGGGAGGTEVAAPVPGTAENAVSNDGGGGGGSVGETRINTATGGVNPLNGAAIRSFLSTGLLETRLVP